MSNLIDVEKVEAIVGSQSDTGKVFVGWKRWVQATHGAWFDVETLNGAREVARTELTFNECPNVYSVVNTWAIENRGLNAYEANVLAGVIWSETNHA